MRKSLAKYTATYVKKDRWIRRVVQLCYKFGLEEWGALVESGRVDDEGMEGIGIERKGLREWEAEVDRRVERVDREKWKRSMREGGMLDKIGYKDWKKVPRWEGDGMGECLRAKVRGGMVGVKGNVFRKRMGEEDLMCPMCGMEEEDVRHWLVECKDDGYRKIREKGGMGDMVDMDRVLGFGSIENREERREVAIFLEEMWCLREGRVVGGGMGV